MFPGRDVLLDAGPLIALLDERDQWHSAVASHWPALAGRCLTTEAVVVEATHMAARLEGDNALVLEYLLRLEIPVFALHMPLHAQCVHLMRRYADVPMDYADATLVAMSDRLQLNRVFTTDRRGFRAYRGSRGVALEIIPPVP